MEVVKFSAHRAELPGKVISFHIVPLEPRVQGGAWEARSVMESGTHAEIATTTLLVNSNLRVIV